MSSQHTLEISSTTNVSFGYDTYLVSALTGDINLILPDMTNIGEGQKFFFQRKDSNIQYNVTIIATNTTVADQPTAPILIRQNVSILYFDGKWQFTYGDLSSSCSLSITEVLNSVQDTFSSLNYNTLTGMTISPPAGYYLVIFNSYGIGLNPHSEGAVALFIDSTEQTGATRDFGDANIGAPSEQKFPLTIIKKVTISSGQVLSIKGKVNKGNPPAGTIRFTKKSLILISI